MVLTQPELSKSVVKANVSSGFVVISHLFLDCATRFEGLVDRGVGLARASISQPQQKGQKRAQESKDCDGHLIPASSDETLLSLALNPISNPPRVASAMPMVL